MATAATLTAAIRAVPSKPLPRVSRPHSQATRPPPTITSTRKVQGLSIVAPSAKAASTTAEATRSTISGFR